jgi:tetratricopeptide (TPR) repeat protein
MDAAAMGQAMDKTNKTEHRRLAAMLTLVLGVLFLLECFYALPIVTRRQAHARAIALYDKALYLTTYSNDEANPEAITSLEQAVQMDPNFAEAHAALALAYVVRSLLFRPDRDLWEKRGYVELQAAKRLKPDLAKVHYVQGRIYWSPASGFAHERAIQEFQLALRSNPNLSEVHNWLGLVYLHIGLLDKALQEFQRALQLNLNNTMAQFSVAQADSYELKYQKTINDLRGVKDYYFPALIGYFVAGAQLGLGQKRDAADTIKRYLEEQKGKDTGGVLNSLQAVLYASEGKKDKALEAIKAAIKIGQGFGHFHHAEYTIASAYALMGEKKQALQWLQYAAKDGFPCYPLFEKDPNLDNLRKDVPFQAFLADQRQTWSRRTKQYPTPY